MVGAGINSRDYAERVPALVEAGADVLCIDSSEGYSRLAEDDHRMGPREHYGDDVKVGAGNVVDARGLPLPRRRAAPTFVKIGIGGGSICITRETKGIGRGQATAVIEVAKARDEYFRRDRHLRAHLLRRRHRVRLSHLRSALAMGADFVMLGRYFARFDESAYDQGHGERHLHEGVLGRGQCPRPQLAAATIWAAIRSRCPLKKASIPTCPTPAA